LDFGDRLARYFTTLSADFGCGYDDGSCCRLVGNHMTDEFELTFSVNWTGDVRGVCWVPAKLTICGIRLESIAWRDGSATEHCLDPSLITSNGTPSDAGFLSFAHLDPRIYLPIRGSVRSVTLRGRWTVDDPTTSALRIDAWLQDTRDRARDLAIRLSSRRYRLADDIVNTVGRIPGLRKTAKLFSRTVQRILTGQSGNQPRAAATLPSRTSP
jgi:hypothetical protein